MRVLPAVVLASAAGCSGAAPTTSGAGGTLPLDGDAGEGGAASASEGAAPRVSASVPLLDAAEVYPAPLWRGNGEEVIVEVSFTEAMRPVSNFVLEAPDHERPATAAWSADAKSLTLTIRPSFSYPRPLADGTTYLVDLHALVSEAGAAVEPNVGLRGGRLAFTTGRHDPVLNHSCGHTFFGPFASFGAALAADESAPDISTTHTEYSVTLPNRRGGFGGWLRAKFATPGPFRLYFDGATRVTWSHADGTSEALSPELTPLACPGIAYQVTLNPPAEERAFFQLEVDESPVRRVIVEHLSDDSSSLP